MSARAIGLTFFAGLRSPVGEFREVIESRWLERVRAPRTYAAKESVPRFGAFRSHGGRRRDADVIESSAIVMDHDAGATREEVAEALGDFDAIAWSTWTPGRWRSLTHTTRPITRAEFPRVWRSHAIDLEARGLVPDYAAKNVSHIYAMPAAREHYEAIELAGALVDVDAALARIPEERPLEVVQVERSDDLAHRISRARSYVAAMDGAIAGSGGHAATFKAALALVRGFALPPDVALEILVQEFNPKCSPAWALFDLRHKIKSASQRARVAPGWLANARRSA